MLAIVRIVRRLLRNEFLKAKGIYLRIELHLVLRTAESLLTQNPKRVAQVQRRVSTAVGKC